MKHAAFVDNENGLTLKERVAEWIRDNEDDILEIINIEYTQKGNIYVATISYLD